MFFRVLRLIDIKCIYCTAVMSVKTCMSYCLGIRLAKVLS